MSIIIRLREQLLVQKKDIATTGTKTVFGEVTLYPVEIPLLIDPNPILKFLLFILKSVYHKGPNQVQNFFLNQYFIPLAAIF